VSLLRQVEAAVSRIFDGVLRLIEPPLDFGLGQTRINSAFRKVTPLLRTWGQMSSDFAARRARTADPHDGERQASV